MASRHRAGLSRERILDAALAVVNSEGLEALSMRRLGVELGVEAMSLYNHVPNKSALLDALHERILDEMAPPPARGTWMAYARQQAKALRAVLVRHPNAVTLFATRPAATTRSLERLETYLGVLRHAGFRAHEAAEIVQCVSSFVVGHTLWSVSAATAPAYASLDPAHFPNVIAAASKKYDATREFERGLDALLRGLDVRADGR